MSNIKKCLLCQKNLEKGIAVNDTVIKFCTKCDLGHSLTNHQKKRIEVIDAKYGEIYLKNYLQNTSLVEANFTKGLDVIQSDAPSNVLRLLDVGCGTGYFLQLIQKRTNNTGRLKWELYGVEPSPVLARTAKKFCKDAVIINGLFEDVEFRSSFFDIITFWDVLEHTENPLKVLEKVRRLLKEDGLLLIQAPNYKSFMTVLTQKDWDWWSPPDHMYHFAPKSIMQLLEKSGLITYRLETQESRDIFIKNIKGRIKRQNLLSRVTRKIFGWFLILIYPIVKSVSTLTKTGGLLFVLAKKHR